MRITLTCTAPKKEFNLYSHLKKKTPTSKQ